jgi:hypothetical protein
VFLIFIKGCGLAILKFTFFREINRNLSDVVDFVRMIATAAGCCKKKKPE